MLSENLESVQDGVVKKQKKQRKQSTGKKSLQVQAHDTNKEAVPRIILLDAVNLIIELRGEAYFTDLIETLFTNAASNRYFWHRFILNIDTNNNEVSSSQLKGIFCLLIYANNKSLPIYGSLKNERLDISATRLLSIGSWKENFKKIKTDINTYQEVTVEVMDIMYLF
jgi:hypothetical protein